MSLIYRLKTAVRWVLYQGANGGREGERHKTKREKKCLKLSLSLSLFQCACLFISRVHSTDRETFLLYIAPSSSCAWMVDTRRKDKSQGSHADHRRPLRGWSRACAGPRCHSSHWNGHETFGCDWIHSREAARRIQQGSDRLSGKLRKKIFIHLYNYDINGSVFGRFANYL